LNNEKKKKKEEEEIWEGGMNRLDRDGRCWCRQISI